MASKKPVLGPAMDRTEDGRMARPVVDPRKSGTRGTAQPTEHKLHNSLQISAVKRRRENEPENSWFE
jgi:hypothetical protein